MQKPPDNYNGPGSVDIGPFQINTAMFPDAGSAVFGINKGKSQSLNGNADANIAYGIGILSSLFNQRGDNAAEYYIVGPNGNPQSNANAVKRQNTYDKYKDALKSLFSNISCFH